MLRRPAAAPGEAGSAGPGQTLPGWRPPPCPGLRGLLQGGRARGQRRHQCRGCCMCSGADSGSQHDTEQVVVCALAWPHFIARAQHAS